MLATFTLAKDKVNSPKLRKQFAVVQYSPIKGVLKLVLTFKKINTALI